MLMIVIFARWDPVILDFKRECVMFQAQNSVLAYFRVQTFLR